MTRRGFLAACLAISCVTRRPAYRFGQIVYAAGPGLSRVRGVWNGDRIVTHGDTLVWVHDGWVRGHVRPDGGGLILG